MLAYVVRHGESLSNLKQTDSLNSTLSDLGRQQAQAIAERLGGARLAAIYSSPFSRSIETAIPLADRLTMPIRIRPDLCEHHMLPAGSERQHEVEPLETIMRAYPQVTGCADHEGPFDWVRTDETLEQLVQRSHRFQAFLKKRWGDDDAVIVFSHGSPTARLIDAWLTNTPGPSFRYIIDNAAVSAVRHHQGVSSLVCLNDISHLTGLPAPASGNYTDDRTIKAAPPTGYW